MRARPSPSGESQPWRIREIRLAVDQDGFSVHSVQPLHRRLSHDPRRASHLGHDLNRLGEAGITISPTGDGKLILRDPDHHLDPNELKWLEGHKAEILDYLTPLAAAEPDQEPEVELIPPDPPAN